MNFLKTHYVTYKGRERGKVNKEGERDRSRSMRERGCDRARKRVDEELLKPQHKSTIKGMTEW